MKLGSFVQVLRGYATWSDRPQVPLVSARPAIAGDLDWSKISPHESLVWHSCHGQFKCARLRVPMDWQGHSAERDKTVDIAVIKIEATVPITDKTYGGAIVLNPGGPGGSGVSQLLSVGHHIRTVVSSGPDTHKAFAKNYDIIGFDVRGVNNTTPTIQCQSNVQQALLSAVEMTSYGWTDTSDVAFDNLWAYSRASAESCSLRFAEEGIAKHVSTAAVARDVVELFERHGEWREKEAARLLNDPQYAHISSNERDEISARAAYRRGEEQIQYWGFSYGTVLGATLAAMYPDRVHRVILDGVEDSFDYMSGDWKTNLRDTDRQFALLAEYCYLGGPDTCALYDSGGPAAIMAHVQKIMVDLKHDPIAVPGTKAHGPGIVTYNDLQRLVVRSSAYASLIYFPTLVSVLEELSRGEGGQLADMKRNSYQDRWSAISHCTEDEPNTGACVPKYDTSDAQAAIACSDGLPWTNVTKREYKAYADRLLSQSSLLGGMWAEITLPCTAWHARPEWRYEGNFTSATRHPILLIGNTADPVTPLSSAFTMAKGFKGAGIMQQDSEGHCTLASVSMCTGRAIRQYFQSGELPGKRGGLSGHDGPGAFCKPDRIPLDGYTRHSQAPLPKGEKDVDLWNALVGLNRR